MDLQRWQKIEDIFQTALDCPSDSREEFVRAECGGDAELRREVEKLIARYETEESFLESPVWTDSLLLQPSLKQQIAVSLENEIPPLRQTESPVGRQIGAYRLTEEIGKGGMGEVYAAERADGEFYQKVAVKLIKRGMDTDFIVKRFRHERQIAATLNHPNIARLLDGGTTSDNLPYFVMEFIEGEPFFKYSETKRLDLRQKLKLFLQVCQAIAYAHGKQIIHRDIKPGNILITDDGEPKLLDFGIAKILDPDLIHESVAPTATQMRLMTPEYASPEQVRGDEITPASDQYSLGVLLYELLTGARPYKFPSRAPHEIARVICEEIPSEPSSGEFGKKSAGNDDFPLDADFCRKLDRIVLKTLRKNPSERYLSVAALVADIERFLRNEPVRAESFTGAESEIEFPPPTVNRDSSAPLPQNAPVLSNSNNTAENNRESLTVNSAVDTASALPMAPPSEKALTPRRAGIKKGAFLIVLSFLLLPILVVLVASIEFLTPAFLFLVFFLVFGGGLIRITYALFFESNLVPQTALVPAGIEFGDSSPRVNLPSAALPTVVEQKRQTGAEENTFGEKSIAVLPLKILSATTGGGAAPDDRFLSVGLADALITRLSNIRQFVVRPTSSVLRYESSETDSFAAGKELGVEFVLDGNVIRIAARIRVSIQLLNVADRSIVWAERFDENFTDVLTLEDVISLKVAESIVPQMTTGELENLAQRGTENPKAYEAYLRGRYHWNTFTENSFAQAFVAYHEAIAHDPDYALAHAGIADYYIWLGIFGVLPPRETYQPAKQAALRAVEINDKLPEAHAALGFARLCGDYDWEQGEKDIRRALALSPNYAVAHNWLGILLLTAVRFDEGIGHARRAVELDPLTYQNYRTLSWGFYFSRRFNEALAEIDRTIEKFPMFGVALANRSWALRAVGRTAEALESSRKAVEIAGGAIFVLFGHAQSLAADGRRDEALEMLRKIETNEKAQYVSRYQVALVYCYLNDTEEALDALEAALADGEGWLVWLKVEPALDRLRDDPRFQSLLQKIKHSPAETKAVPNSFGQK